MGEHRSPIARATRRRAFLQALTVAAAAVALPGHALAVALGERESRALLRLARLLLPHPALPDDVYANVVSVLNDDPGAVEDLRGGIRAGLADLDRRAGGDWLTAPESTQVEILTGLENDLFLTGVLERIRRPLYRHPAVWALIGYPGSSREYGGYLERGFNDIDWLSDEPGSL